jgi:hypothetical protein
MEKILREASKSEGIVVYVSPTKALVNQVEAGKEHKRILLYFPWFLLYFPCFFARELCLIALPPLARGVAASVPSGCGIPKLSGN